MAVESSRKGIWRTNVAGKIAELLYREYKVPNSFLGAPEIPTEVLNLLERPASFRLEPLQTIFGLVFPTFSGDEVLKGRRSGTFRIRLLNTL